MTHAIRSLTLAAVAPLMLPGLATAQFPATITARATTDLEVRAYHENNNPLNNTLAVAANTNISSGSSLAVQRGGGKSRAESTVTLEHTSAGAMVYRIRERTKAHADGEHRARAWVGRGDQGNPLLGHKTRLRLLPTMAALGVVRITYATIDNYRHGDASNAVDFRVDIGDDGSNEFHYTDVTGGDVRTFHVDVPASGLDIVTRTASYSRSSNDRAGHVGELTIEFLPPGWCHFTPRDTGCGLDLDGDQSYQSPVHHIHLLTTGAPPLAPAVVGVGSRLQNPVPVPGNCNLLVGAFAQAIFLTDANGRGQFTVSVPWDMRFTLHAQSFALDVPAATVSGSQRLKLDCR